MDENDLDPIVGNWYTHVDDGQTFVVLAIDEDKGVIEIQHEDGDMEELELGEWSDMDLEPAEAPEGWESAADPDAEDDTSFGEPDAPTWRAPAGGGRRRASAKEEWDDSDDDDEDEDEDDWDDDYGDEDE